MISHFFLHPVPQSCKMYHFCFVFIPLDHYETLTGLIYLLILNFQCLWPLKSSEFFAILLFPKACLLGSFLTSFSCILLGPLHPSMASTTTYLLMNPKWLPSALGPDFPTFWFLLGHNLLWLGNLNISKSNKLHLKQSASYSFSWLMLSLFPLPPKPKIVKASSVLFSGY